LRKLKIFNFAQSLRALVNPGAKQADLLGRQRFRRREIAGTAWAARRPACGIIRPAGLRRGAGARAAFARATLRRHSGFIIDTSCSYDHEAFVAFTRLHDLAIVTAFQHAIAAIEAKAAFGPVLAMATDARLFEQRLNVFHKRDINLARGRGKFGGVNLAQVRVMFGSKGRAANRDRSAKGQSV
jgi:hypothetical protein